MTHSKLKNEQSATAMMLPEKLSFTPCRTGIALAIALTLVACGDSDLADLHAEKIEAAVEAAAAAEQAEAAAVAAGADAEVAAESSDPDAGAAMPVAPADADALAPSAATLEAIDVTEYSLVFNDEFNTPVLDASKWNTAMAWGSDLVINEEDQYYVDTQANPDSAYNPFRFDGESIIITADAAPESMADTVNGQSHVSGALTTLGKFDMSYGYVEARVDLPEGAGLWPSIWMLGSDFKDLKPQLYLMEYNGAEPNSVFHNYNYTDSDGNLRSPRQHEVVVEGASEGWQTIGVRWSVGELVYYVNGYPTFQVSGANVASQAMYLIMNMAVGGLWVDDPDASTPLPSEFKVDYVRIYQRN